MGLTVQIDSKAEYEPITEMIQPAVLADIVDKGMVPNKFKPGTEQHKCYFAWIVAETDAEGRNKRVFESFTLSLHEKATLRKRLKELGYKDFEPGVPFDIEVLIGTKRTLVLSTEDGDDGRTFVRILATQPLPKGSKGVDIPADFVRKGSGAEPAKSAQPKPSPKPAPQRDAYRPVKAFDAVEQGITDDDIPL